MADQLCYFHWRLPSIEYCRRRHLGLDPPRAAGLFCAAAQQTAGDRSKNRGRMRGAVSRWPPKQGAFTRMGPEGAQCTTIRRPVPTGQEAYRTNWSRETGCAIGRIDGARIRRRQGRKTTAEHGARFLAVGARRAQRAPPIGGRLPTCPTVLGSTSMWFFMGFRRPKAHSNRPGGRSNERASGDGRRDRPDRRCAHQPTTGA